MRKVDLDTAAGHFGLSKDAIRKRIKRGTMEAERDKAGKWWVIITDETDIPGDELDADKDVYAMLYEEMRQRVSFLEKELDKRDDEITRRDHIIMNLTNKIPQLQAPQEEGERLPWWRRIFKR